MEENHAQWEAEIAALEKKADALQRENPLLFVGSSTVRLWHGIERDFAKFNAMNQGFGGSQISDVLHFLPRLVLSHNPRAIAHYGGGNDLAAGKTPERILSDSRMFIRRVRENFPDCFLFLLSVKPEPARIGQWPQAQIINGALQREAAQLSQCVYVDLAAPLLDENGGVRTELFEDDRAHLNEAGSALWTQKMLPIVAGHLL